MERVGRETFSLVKSCVGVKEAGVEQETRISEGVTKQRMFKDRRGGDEVGVRG